MLKIHRKKGIALSIFATFSLLSAGCGADSSGAGSSDAGAEDKKLKIGFQASGLETEYIAKLADSMEKAAEEMNVDLTVMDGNYDLATNISQLETLKSQQVDAIVVNALDAEALNSTVNSIVDSGIPVIGVTASLTAEKLTSYVGSPDVTGGEMAAKEVVNALGGKGNIVIFEGPVGISAQIDRREGIYKVLDENSGIKVIAEKTANWSRSEAMSLMENWIQKYGDDIDGVIAQNDEMALGALNALKAKKIDIPVVGIDGIADAQKAVENGEMVATIFQNAEAQGEKAVEAAVKAAKGEKVEKLYDVPFELIK
ncbi:substrate-binding domain-containing protein [Domibacillus sp. DTU_2020_1001157_1_SI_ALB_TIR_016]|uniref:substrate-binding domain-containing protein n=1 Tax=Domibacillus sp. DTU_2020_1001157_1_SI_ALB_TIR_016 TaxID=3077789 RepID=UPI0028E1FD82|nr:substrate-binding domain-containing protein [Domibacillus sp. DTU_2020_1001157_1_SI_ALB_TIR_016]WNS78778.1 substrate-binding domain-containing protein [Domibacillus sp. DTU_2020_1001157_1_SI_ALB_TIR_016]